MTSILLTDLYQLTMAYGYWQQKTYQQPSVFHLYFRKAPFGERFALAAGLQTAIQYLENFHFEVEEIQYLASLTGYDKKRLFDESFLNHLQRIKFQCSVSAIAEGTAVLANEPLMRIEGPLLQAQLVETALLNIINFQTLVATKAARIVAAADGDAVIEFGLRRAQGADGAVSASRAAYIGGCVGTSNVLAGMLHDIPVKGTHAHSWVMAHGDELAAFRNYAAALPHNCIFLVDTYNTIEGIKKAITVGNELRAQGARLIGIRLDSGDLTALSIAARTLLDAAGMHDASIVASNDLDEYEIRRLKAAGAKINVWGVGTKLVTAYDQPALGGVYKLAALQDQNTQEWAYKIKKSEDKAKASLPGILGVNRQLDTLANTCKDTIYHTQKNKINEAEGTDLLQVIYEKGKLIYTPPTIAETRRQAMHEWQIFSGLTGVNVGLDADLQELITVISD